MSVTGSVLDLHSARYQRVHDRVRAYLDPGRPLAEVDQEAREKGRARLQDRGVLLYCPLYVSNVCVSGCLYCGFRAAPDNRVQRRRLTPEEVAAEADVLARMGLHNILLVSGDDPGLVPTGHLRRIMAAVGRPDRSLWLEVQPQPVDEYRRMVTQGAAVFVHYQETYDPDRYEALHPYGAKSRYVERVSTPERAIAGGARRLGLGVLLGLADPARDCAALLLHVEALHEAHPDVHLSVSLPRLRFVPHGFQIPQPVDDDRFRRLLAALSCLLPEEIDLSLTTREPAPLRDDLVGYGTTLMSAGSRTSPGAYAGSSSTSAEQFALSDHRSVPEVIAALEAQGLRVSTAPA